MLAFTIYALKMTTVIFSTTFEKFRYNHKETYKATWCNFDIGTCHHKILSIITKKPVRIASIDDI